MLELVHLLDVVMKYYFVNIKIKITIVYRVVTLKWGKIVRQL